MSLTYLLSSYYVHGSTVPGIGIQFHGEKGKVLPFLGIHSNREDSND